MAKQGTPTMGGTLIVVTCLAAIWIFVRDARVLVPFTLALVLYARLRRVG
jgi:UDP-N-acetylmuramyl pentapeptide phosphotransferase/UDP-N-acetylglucosamine-1-phosphate transferase